MNNKDSRSKLMNMGHGEEVSKQLNPATMDCLPDDLLVQILSFLPMKQAASTSVISKRWRTLFAYTHNLDFDEPIVSYDECNQWKRRDIRKRFRDFAYRTLALQEGNHIQKLLLRLDTYSAGGVDVVKHWICYASKHGVSELHLYIYTYPRFLDTRFLGRVFTSTTLVKLSLGSNFTIDRVPSDASLPALKVLFLDTIWFKGDQFSNVFLAACPALEDLTIRDDEYDHPEFVYVISSKTIKKLSVTYHCGDYFSRIIPFDTPNVVDFYYSNYLGHNSPQCRLDSLAKATLDLSQWRHVKNGMDVTNLISGLCNVKTLHLTISAVEVISVYKGGLPVFKNLTDLVFSSTKEGWKVLLTRLLQRSPNLQTLALSCLDGFLCRRHRFTRIPRNNQIKMLRIMKFQGYASELKHIRHFLQKMKCLEVVQIYVAAAMDDPKKMQLRENLLKLPPASSKLKIQVI